MNKKKSGAFKSAFRALAVNQPLRLGENGPQLLPPHSRKEVPPDEGPRPELPQPQRAQDMVTRTEDTKDERAQNVGPCIGVAATAEKKKAETDPWCSNDEHARNKRTQIEYAQKLVPQREVASCQVPQDELSPDEHALNDEFPQSVSGFFKLSHAIFSEPAVRELSGDCFRLFLWLSMRAWRYPNSPGVTRASVRYMETQTGMSHATVSRSLKTLKESRLISLLEMDYKRGNIWKVSSVALSGRGPDLPPPPIPEDKSPRSERPQNEGAQIGSQAATKRERSSLNSRAEPPQIARNFKKFKNKRNLSEEAEHRSQLVYATADYSGQKSPEQEREETIWRMQALERFETELNDQEQNRYVAMYAEREFPHGFMPPRCVVSKMAAWEWGRKSFCREHSPSLRAV